MRDDLITESSRKNGFTGLPRSGKRRRAQLDRRTDADPRAAKDSADYKSRLAAIVEPSNNAIISYTLDGVLDSWNHGAERLYGYTASEAIGQPIALLIPAHQAGEASRIIEKVRQGLSVNHYETQRLGKDGRLVDISLTVSPIKNTQGGIVGVSAVGHDIRDRKRIEAERNHLMQQLRERIKELTVMYSVAHLVQLEDRSTARLLEELASILPQAWQHPELMAARLKLGEFEYQTPNFRLCRWIQRVEFTTTDDRNGMVEVVYLSEQPHGTDGPFLPAERNLINCVAETLKAYWERKRLEAEILEISEREQRRIGQDMHDTLSQHLRGIAYLSHVLNESLIRRSLPESSDSARISQLLNEAVDQTRLLSRGLFPVELESDGLMSALEALANTVSDIYKISCEFACPEPVLIDDNATAIHLYRIAQEAAFNAVRHGRASRVTISLSISTQELTLRVQDNGRGFPKVLPRTRGMGLRMMQHRAHVIGAKLSHQTAPQGGVALTCRLPATHQCRENKGS
jgi:PAS domain S-box-containing protein